MTISNNEAVNPSGSQHLDSASKTTASAKKRKLEEFKSALNDSNASQAGSPAPSNASGPSPAKQHRPPLDFMTGKPAGDKPRRPPLNFRTGKPVTEAIKGQPKFSTEKGSSPVKSPAKPPAKSPAKALPTKATPTKRPVGRPRKTPIPIKRVEEGDDDDEDVLSATENFGTPSKSTGKRLWGPTAAPATPRGILTPSKNRAATPKSVKFDKQVGTELFFADLPSKGMPASAKFQNEPEPVADIVCGVCRRPHSKPPNEIILCDNCDYAVHQLCCGVEEIPEGDWLCRSCSQEDAINATPKASAPLALKATATTVPTAPVDLPDIPNLDQHVRSLQRVLLDRCLGQRRIEMFGLHEVREKCHQMIEQTVVAGEGNSMLLIGARGSGKTTMLENVIDDIHEEHSNDFHVVRLSGFIHTDDKLALKEIWRQLGKEMDVEDDLMNRTNYADTMASLLALLSHPSEILGTDEGVTSQSIIFVIDEFDMFAAHPRQTLLYNLFDVAQSRKAPIAVLGCTTRLSVVEMLEKRVKSRFSHRYVYLTMARSLPAYWQVCKQGLLVEEKDASKEGLDVDLDGYAQFHQYWNAKIEDMYKLHTFQELLQYHYYTNKSPSAFFNEWVLPLASLSASNLNLEIPSIASQLTSLSSAESKIHLLPALSDLDLGLLIAAARLDIVAHTDTVNFAMAYDEYTSLVGRQRIQSASSGMLAVGGGVRVWSRGVAGIAWERLISLGLLVPSGINGGKGMAHGSLEGRMWKVDVALEEIPLGVKLSNVLGRWCKEL
ncbi:origin recognition complex subunit 4 C-terminus-domain-containing protein [Emericellopsis atlantica]|uniref:Origin recognition complex subunit 4 C-terminus-domain-containing protein n=1 Tax=Emericellopsis atlantica TaxID=2614577 RepID=A0A9P8CTH4_9HYPO|nr:origin recognition complex subunit 4 C-terminus-domain-containing protein [Emericellopsis atlantica]KAG9259169.1 origin recognition complex subunit 4 C-terminus-domain-containing protein [Emericellopsis atlantica]